MMRRGGIGAVGLAVALAAAARAEDRAIDLQLFRPPVDSKGFFTQNGSIVLDHLDWSLGMISNWGLRTLELDTADGREFHVEHLVTAHLQAAIGLFDHGEAGVGLPFTIWQPEAVPDTTPPGAQGIGDVVLHGKVKLLAVPAFPIGIGMLVTLSLPTGSDHEFTSEGQIVVWPQLVVDREWGKGVFRIGANGGARLRPEARAFQDRDDAPGTGDCPVLAPQNCGTGMRAEVARTEITYGGGFALGIIRRRFDFVGEVFGSNGKRGDSDVKPTPLEALGGFKLYLARNSFLAFGGGAGLVEALGAPDARAFLMLIFEPSIGDKDRDGLTDDVDRCPFDPEDYDAFLDRDGCPDPDNDRDGILDVNDQCPDDPEDFDGFQDQDGCPELDNDKDGIVDRRDRCPNIPEVFNSIDDEDGCPDADTDGDGFADDKDGCPLDPENFNGFQDQDGCPDSDRDGDRIADDVDKCPDEPETYNGIDDDDGCPDKGRVVVRETKIEIIGAIYFKTGKADIQPRSFSLLDEIAGTLVKVPMIELVEIQGHADERGAEDMNMRLTQARVESVRKYLVDKGVESSRLSAVGYGETRPICTQHRESCWKRNRRVEFLILKRAGLPAVPSPSLSPPPGKEPKSELPDTDVESPVRPVHPNP